MCQIIVKEPNHTIPINVLRNAFDNNPDGLGILSVIDGKIHVVHSLASWNECLESIEAIMPYKAIIHFRYGTSGGITKDNLHPFKLPNDWWLFHNGILDCVDYTQLKNGMNDTQLFIRTHLNEIMKHDSYNIIEYLDQLGMMIGEQNRMILVSDVGEFYYINRHTFVDYPNTSLILGNTYSLVNPKPKNNKWRRVPSDDLMNSDSVIHDRWLGILYAKLKNNHVIWALPSDVNYSPTWTIDRTENGVPI